MQTCEHPEYLGRTCVTIDKPMYFAFLAFSCYSTYHSKTPVGDCLELSPQLHRHARVYNYMMGAVLSTALGEKYDTSLPYTNAPRTDDVQGEYLVAVKPVPARALYERQFGNMGLSRRSLPLG